VYLVTAVRQNDDEFSTTTTVSFIRITQFLIVTSNSLLLLRNKTHPKLRTITHTFHLSHFIQNKQKCYY